MSRNQQWFSVSGTIVFILVLLNGNPLTNIASTENRAGVMVNGRWIAESEIQKRLAEIAARAAGM